MNALDYPIPAGVYRAKLYDRQRLSSHRGYDYFMEHYRIEDGRTVMRPNLREEMSIGQEVFLKIGLVEFQGKLRNACYLNRDPLWFWL